MEKPKPSDQAMQRPKDKQGPGLFSLLGPYCQWIMGLVVLTILGNGLNLIVPRLLAGVIDTYNQPGFTLSRTVVKFFAVAVGIFVLAYLQNIVQTYAAEKIARDLRSRLVEKISAQDHVYIQEVTPAELLTNLTSDVDSIKMFVSQAIASIISSLFLILGAGALLLSINWKLGLLVLSILPVIGGT